MKIKIKAKTVIVVLVLIILLIPFTNMVLADYFSNSGKAKVAEKLYDYYLKFPNGLRKDEALYKMAETTMNGFGRYSIMMGMRLGEKNIDYNTINKAIDSYEKIIEKYPKSKYYSPAYKGVLDSYIYLGDRTKVEKWINWGRDRDHKEIRDISTLYEGYDFFVNREYNKAEEILETFVLGNEDLDYIYYFLKGHIEFAKEDFHKALEYYNKVSEMGWQHRRGFFGSRVPDRRKDWLENLDFKEGEYKIKGRVTANGVGIPYVEVYLQKLRQGYSSSGIDFVAITDKDGYYETIGVKEGKYDLGIGIGTGILFEKSYLDKGLYNIEVPFTLEYDFQFEDQIQVIKPKPDEILKTNKFEVEWEKVEGAEYYGVKLTAIEDNGTMTVSIRDENRNHKIKENKAVFNIDTIKNSPTGYSIDENGVVSPEAITGYLYGGKKNIIMVDAYNKEGFIIGSSMPMASYYENQPSLIIEKQPTEGEKLIVNKEYKRAVDYYEDLLLKDKDNIEALSYLSKLYIYGWGKGTKDSKIALDYGRRAYDITQDADLLLKILGEMGTDDYRENKEEVKQIFNIIPTEYRDEYFHWHRGEYYMALGELEKAREDFIKGDIHNDYIVYIDIYMDKYKRAIDFMKHKDTKFYYMSKSNLIKGIEGLEELDKDNKYYMVFKEYLYEIIKKEKNNDDLDKAYEERKQDFYKIYNFIKEPSIKMILEEIKTDNHWD